MEYVKAVIGANDPIAEATRVLMELPEGARVTIVTDTQLLMVRAGKVRRDLPDYPAWMALFKEEGKRIVSYDYNKWPISHKGIKAE